MANTSNWLEVMQGGTVDTPECNNATNHHRQGPQCSLNVDWGQLWQLGSKGYQAAWRDFLDGEVEIKPCPSNLTWNWPPQELEEF